MANNNSSMFLFCGPSFCLVYLLSNFFLLVSLLWFSFEKEGERERERIELNGKRGWEDLEGVREGERHDQDILSEKNVINKKEMVVHGTRRGRFSPGWKGFWGLCKMWEVDWWGTSCEEKPGKNGTLAQECWGRGSGKPEIWSSFCWHTMYTFHIHISLKY